MFTATEPFSGITHITDAMGVSFTLIEGSDRALLFDTGYGTENVAEWIRGKTAKPLKVILSHGHHDHVLGSRWFSETYLCGDDLPEFAVRTGFQQRMKVKQKADTMGIPLPDDFLTAPIKEPRRICFAEKTAGFESLRENLGGISVQIIKVPGHTPGSIMLYIPQYDLLLTGDNWNPCTWMWFPSSLSAKTWRKNMYTLIDALEKELEKPIHHVLCSHQPILREGEELKAFLEYMTEDRMEKSEAVDMGSTIHTYQVTEKNREWTLVLDKDKI